MDISFSLRFCCHNSQKSESHIALFITYEPVELFRLHYGSVFFGLDDTAIERDRPHRLDVLRWNERV